MLARVNSGAVVGLDGVLVDVEVDIVKKGFPGFTIVGLPGKAVEEAKERVKSALLNSSAEFPHYRITVNLAPADLRKQGPAYDLPIALGILIASEQIAPSEIVSSSMWLGELSLDGTLRSTPGILSMTLLAREHGFKRIFVPAQNAQEAAVVRGIDVIALASLQDLYRLLLSGEMHLHPTVFDRQSIVAGEKTSQFDFAHIYGQEHAKRALEIAAAGGHNIIMIGPPGSGKTLLSRAFTTILPPLTEEESLEVTKIYSVTGTLDSSEPLVTVRPFRSPHHTTSRIGLIGGGQHLTPGEISLAHRGVLFLDEFPELPRSVLESLRQPLEDGWVVISRAHGSVTYPSRVLLIAAANPCPCGYKNSGQKQCVCNVYQIQKYQKRISGPILDRIDLQITVPMVEVEKILGAAHEDAEGSSHVKNRVVSARAIQRKRLHKEGFFVNAEMDTVSIKKYCALNQRSQEMVKAAIERMQLSVRGVHKILKVARTIADLSHSAEINEEHIAEAMTYRFTDVAG